MNLHLIAQNSLLTQLRNELRDNGATKRWTDTEIYTALNQALSGWQGRVSVPALYQPANFSWSYGTLEYSLPNYIDEDGLDPQQRVLASTLPTIPPLSTSELTWESIHGWVVDPKADGSRTLRFMLPPQSTDARILYWLRNSELPITVPTLSSTINSTATSLTVEAALDSVGDTGWVKVESEFMQYSGATRGASTTTLNNLVRAVNDSAAASHNSSTSVYFCVAAPVSTLWRQLLDQAKAHLHQLFFTNASPQERDMHGQMLQLYQASADRFWRSYVSQKPYMMRLTRSSVGVM